jgi:putative copper export protein
MDNLLLGEQVLCLSLVDGTLAFLCGLLLAGFWARRSREAADGVTSASIFRPSLHWPALILPFALCAGFWLLTVAMTGRSSPGAIVQSMPDVAATHAGRVTLSMLSLSVLLVAASLIRLRSIAVAQNRVAAALIAAILIFHAALGHAAGNGDFTRAELLQFLHLVAMALWTGGVFVSATLALPFLSNASASAYTSWLRQLSRTSVWSASTAFLTGALKGWTAIGAQLGNLGQPGWSRILVAKLSFVCIALDVGLLHRRQVHDRSRQWNALERKWFIRTLRVEAFCLAVVILLSAWLSSVDPPE